MYGSIDLSQAQIPDLSSRRVVVVGGTGGVGEGAVRGWLNAGAEVIVPSRTEGKVAQFSRVIGELADSPRLHFVIGEYTDFDSADQMADRITKEFGQVTDVVASIGGWWQRAPLWGVSQSDWQKYFVDLITAHVAQVRAWIPRMADSGSYQLILGGSATTVVPGASLMNMEQSGLLMMRKVLAAEVGDQRRITSVVLGPVITRQRPSFDPDWVSAEEVGLVTVGVGANDDVLDVDFGMRDKEQITAVLKALEILPRSGGAAAQSVDGDPK
jgi:3-oxoacyl-[acyl-carrier protein] reductase